MDIIFNTFKVRYEKMDALFAKHCTEVKVGMNVNVFINLESIMRRLIASNIEIYLKVKGEEKIHEMISNIINLAAHYRMYFTKYKLYSKVYLYLGYPFRTEYLNGEINGDYRKDYRHRYTKDDRYASLINTLDRAIPLAKIILEYIEGVYLITSNDIEPSLIPYIIQRDKPTNTVPYIVTTDRYEYQYANKDFYILRPKRADSYMLTKANAMNILRQEEKVTSDITVGTNFLPFILSLTGDKNRTIEKMKGAGVATLLRILDKGIKDHVIGADITSPQLLERILAEKYVPLFRRNFLCTDLDSQYNRLNIRNRHSITEQVVDKFDDAELKRLNNEYFEQYPIQLVEVSAATHLKKAKKKDLFL